MATAVLGGEDFLLVDDHALSLVFLEDPKELVAGDQAGVPKIGPQGSPEIGDHVLT